MTQLTPTPENETQDYTIQEKVMPEEVIQEQFHFIPGDLEPIDSKKKFPAILKQAFRPMFFGAIAIHGLLLFTPLKSSHQAKPKETAEPVKLARLSDKVLVKSLPKVKVTAAPKKANLPKVAVASTNPIVVTLPEPEKSKIEDSKPEDKKIELKKPEDTSTASKQSDSKPTDGKQSDKGIDPSTVDPKNRTTDESKAGKPSDKDSAKFSSIFNELNKTFNPNEELALIPEITQLQNPTPFFNVNPPPKDGAAISNQDVDDVVTGLKSAFPGTGNFSKKGAYGGADLYEAKIGEVIRYISVIKADNVEGKNVLIFLWEKPPT